MTTRAPTLPSPDPGEVEYPESDGQPLAESDAHARYMIDVRATLENHFADQPDFYVSGNLLLYDQEGVPRQVVAPDVFVVRGIRKGWRPSYKLWQEGRPPNWVLEVTSRGTRGADLGAKRCLYAWMGVREYFLYDPLAEYLRPPLQGLRLEGGEYRAIEPDAAGALVSAALGLRLVLVEGRLRLRDRRTDAELLSPAEARRAEAARADAEAAARQAAERRIAELEALLARRREP